MANLADCAFAVAKDDLNKMNGALRKAEEGEKAITLYKRIYKNKNGEMYEVYERYEGSKWSASRITLKQNGQIIQTWLGEDCKNCKVSDDLWDKGYKLEDSIVLKNVEITDGWVIDWKKLNSYSYDYDPRVEEHADHITVFFGGRWDFPSSLEDKLNEMDVRWQGAGCEDGMDWEFDDGGNSDFGLRIGREKEYCDGEPYTQRYVYDESN